MEQMNWTELNRCFYVSLPWGLRTYSKIGGRRNQQNETYDWKTLDQSLSSSTLLTHCGCGYLSRHHWRFNGIIGPYLVDAVSMLHVWQLTISADIDNFLLGGENAPYWEPLRYRSQRSPNTTAFHSSFRQRSFSCILLFAITNIFSLEDNWKSLCLKGEFSLVLLF